MKLLDRLLLRAFLQAWLICFTSLVALYVVIDAFQRLDDFLAANQAGGWANLWLIIADYYGVQLAIIFDRLAGTMTLLAALFTLAWMQKSNELIPLLATGVPLRRLLRPILLGTLLFIGLGAANRELLLPRLASRLQKPPDDPEGRRLVYVGGMYDTNDVLIEGHTAQLAKRVVYRFSATLPPQLAGMLLSVKAKEAHYIPPGEGPNSGGWLLIETQPAEPPPLPTDVLRLIDPGKLFLRTERVTFEVLTRPRGWHEYASSADLYAELDRGEATNLASLAMQVHQRQVAPLVTLVTVLLGVGLLLRDLHRAVFINIALCLGMAGLLYAAGLAARYLGERDFVQPALAAWLPVLFFGPLAWVQLDAAKS